MKAMLDGGEIICKTVLSYGTCDMIVSAWRGRKIDIIESLRAVGCVCVMCVY